MIGLTFVYAYIIIQMTYAPSEVLIQKILIPSLSQMRLVVMACGMRYNTLEFKNLK